MTDDDPGTSIDEEGAAGPVGEGSPERLTRDQEIGHYIDMWKQAVEVQMHFNDIEWRIRGLALTVATFALGAAGVAAKDGTRVGWFSMWAERTGPGRYRLLSNSYFAPLAVGDCVQTVDGESGLIITDLIESGPMAVSVIQIDATVPNDEVRALADSWLAWGASWSEGAFGILTTVWQPHVDADEVFDLLVHDLRCRAGWSTPMVYAPEDRTSAGLRAVAIIDG